MLDILRNILKMQQEANVSAIDRNKTKTEFCNIFPLYIYIPVIIFIIIAFKCQLV